MILRIVLILAAAVLPVLVAVLDITRRSDDDWNRTGESRVAWLVVSILGGALGSAVYLLHARPKFARPPVKSY